jgi:ferredoxin-NADP reductase
MVRTYSLCNDPADNKCYRVAVKREPAGRGGSAKLHDQVRVGDVIGVSLPRGGLASGRGDLPLHLRRGRHRHHAVLSGGGVAAADRAAGLHAAPVDARRAAVGAPGGAIRAKRAM